MAPAVRIHPEARNKKGHKMKNWKQIKETETALWFKNSSGEIVSVPKS